MNVTRHGIDVLQSREIFCSAVFNAPDAMLQALLSDHEVSHALGSLMSRVKFPVELIKRDKELRQLGITVIGFISPITVPTVFVAHIGLRNVERLISFSSPFTTASIEEIITVRFNAEVPNYATLDYPQAYATDSQTVLAPIHPNFTYIENFILGLSSQQSDGLELGA